MATAWPQERTRTSDVMAASRSSRESTTSNFDPDNEALVSTTHHEYDLPTPKVVARRKYERRSSNQDDQDYAIDTSVLRNNFPEFTTVSSSDEDADDASIEIGRGGRRRSSRQLDDSRDSIMSVNESHHSGSPVVKPARIYNSPSRGALQNLSSNIAQRITSMGRDSLRKDAQIRRASLAHKDDQDQKSKSGTRQPSNSQRRTLSEMHAKATETYDGSYISDERPQSGIITARNTRFASNGTKEQAAKVADAVNIAAGKAYLKAQKSNVRENQGQTIDTLPDNNTHQSFALPDIPNLSELVSGIYQDGVPAVSNSPRPRNTRFASPPATGAGSPRRSDHRELDAVPIPDDEKDIFVSLKSLQDKVAKLEAEKSAAEQRIEELHRELVTGRALQQDEGPQSAIRSANDRAHHRSSGKLAIEKARLEEANAIMHDKLQAANRQILAHETTIKNLTQERDTAISQLGSAFLSAQELKQQNNALKQENDEMRARLERLAIYSKAGDQRTGQSNGHAGKLASRIPDVTSTTNEDEDTIESRSMTQSRLPRRRHQSQPNNLDYSQRRTSLPEAEFAKLQKEKDLEQLFSIFPPQHKHRPSEAEDSKKNLKGSLAGENKLPNTSKQRVRKTADDETGRSHTSGAGMRTGTRRVREDVTNTGDMTLLTFIDEQEIADLRKTLEEERIARKRQEKLLKSNPGAAERPERSKFVPEVPIEEFLKQVSEEMTRSKAAEQTLEPRNNNLTGDVTSRKRDRSAHRQADQRAPSTSSRPRRRSSKAEMTSAFILPDITMHSTAAAARIPAGAQRVLDNMVQHEGPNCSVCKRQNNCQCTHSQDQSKDKQTFHVPKPIPVSSRMPGPSMFNDEPTVRPSQPPAVALAKVLKGLDDELAHLKMQLALYQNALNKHDASLGKKPRKKLLRKIEWLLTEIDTKSDQIYSLYDVLEGQKEAGNEMTERDIEMTLQSIGIDAPARKDEDLTGRLGDDGVFVDDEDDEYESGIDDDDLPWEGIQSTVEFTGRSQSSRRQHY